MSWYMTSEVITLLRNLLFYMDKSINWNGMYLSFISFCYIIKNNMLNDAMLRFTFHCLLRFSRTSRTDKVLRRKRFGLYFDTGSIKGYSLNTATTEHILILAVPYIWPLISLLHYYYFPKLSRYFWSTRSFRSVQLPITHKAYFKPSSTLVFSLKFNSSLLMRRIVFLPWQSSI
jgi:hypothetical protein